MWEIAIFCAETNKIQNNTKLIVKKGLFFPLNHMHYIYNKLYWKPIHYRIEKTRRPTIVALHFTRRWTTRFSVKLKCGGYIRFLLEMLLTSFYYQLIWRYFSNWSHQMKCIEILHTTQPRLARVVYFHTKHSRSLRCAQTKIARLTFSFSHRYFSHL